MADNPTKYYVQPGSGIKLEYSLVKTPPTWVAIDDLRQITFPVVTAGKIPASSLSQTNRVKRKMVGWDDLDDIEQTVAATTANYTAIRLLFDNRTVDIYFRFTYPADPSGTAGITDCIAGFVSKYSCGEATQERDELMEIKFTITVNQLWEAATAPTALMDPSATLMRDRRERDSEGIPQRDPNAARRGAPQKEEAPA